MKKALVVAHYKENLDWLDEIGDDVNVYLYCKWNLSISEKFNDRKNFRIQTLENIGNEQHTYFYHILNNYVTLEDLIYFCQGNPYEHCCDFDNKIKSGYIGPMSDFNLITTVYGEVDLTKYHKHINHKYDGVSPEQILNITFADPRNDEEATRSIGYIIDHLPELGIEKKNWVFNANGLYSTRKEVIKEFTLEFYQKCFDLFYDKDVSMVEFVFERINKFILAK
jgi:hypothetical protein